MATTVLIVDDHPGFRASARMLLEAEGFDVVGEAGDGRSGLDAAAELQPDVVLLDIQLPDMDGFAVAAGLDSNGNGAGRGPGLEPRARGPEGTGGGEPACAASSPSPSSRAPRWRR